MSNTSPTDTPLDLERAFRTIEKFPRSGASLVTKEGIKAEFARYRSEIEAMKRDSERLDEVEQLIRERRLGWNGFAFYTFPIPRGGHLPEHLSLRDAIDAARAIGRELDAARVSQDSPQEEGCVSTDGNLRP